MNANTKKQESEYFLRMTNLKTGETDRGLITAYTDEEADTLGYELAVDHANFTFDWDRDREDKTVRIAIQWMDDLYGEEVLEDGGVVVVTYANGELDTEDTYTVER